MTRIAEDHVLSPRMPVAIVGMSKPNTTFGEIELRERQ